MTHIAEANDLAFEKQANCVVYELDELSAQKVGECITRVCNRTLVRQTSGGKLQEVRECRAIVTLNEDGIAEFEQSTCSVLRAGGPAYMRFSESADQDVEDDDSDLQTNTTELELYIGID